MIKCHLSRLMGEKKVKIADVAKDIGVHRNTITLLYYEKAKRIDFEVLEKLCKYFDCSISELLEYRK
jgi:putative transcriptional regulator